MYMVPLVIVVETNLAAVYACLLRGNVLAHERNAKRHVKTSKRCLELRHGQ